MEIKDREGLRYKIQDAFDLSDLKTLCFDLDVEYEDFPLKKKEFVIEFISYFEDRDQISLLIKRLEVNRPMINWLSFIVDLEQAISGNKKVGDISAKKDDSNDRNSILINHFDKENLDRGNWFEQLGFVRDRYPFGSTARRGEVDNILKNYPETFVFPPGLPRDQLLGTEDRPGHVYFFGPSGGGKTSLLQYMKDLIAEEAEATSTITIEYFDNFKPDGDHNLFFANQIVERIIKKIDDLIVPASKNPAELINKVVKQCMDRGIRRIYILVDQVDSDPTINFASIMSLVANRNVLEIEGLRFKFFLPLEYKNQLTKQIEIYGYFELRWNQGFLKKVLNQRLTACLREDLRSSITPLGLLCEQDIASDIENKLFNCITIETPRQMWFFLEKLIDMHFSDDSSARLLTERINSETFKRVCEGFRPKEEPVKKGNKDGDRIEINIERNAQAIINVNSELTSVVQQIDSLQEDDTFKQKLKEAIIELQNHLKEVPFENEDDIEIISDSVQTLVNETNKKKQNKKKIQITSENLKRAAQNIAEISPIILEIATKIVDIITRRIS